MSEAHLMSTASRGGDSFPDYKALGMPLNDTEHDRLCASDTAKHPAPRRLFPTVDRDALHFGVRMGVSLAISSLFVLIQSPGSGAKYPQGMWVLITVLFVCWFPSLDAASVVEKSVQRLYGTMIGAALGLFCGFLSLAVLGKNENNLWGQSIVLIFCIGIVSFGICFSAVHFKIDGTKIIARYNYACILCLLTFAICVLPFYSDEEKKWVKSMYRVVNVIVGCVIGACLSIFVFPRSTPSILRQKMEKQIELAGEASRAVLHTAADCFSENVTYVPLPLAGEMLESPRSTRRRRTRESQRPWRSGEHGRGVDLGGDVAIEKFESAIKEWRASKSHLSMLKYDPFNVGMPENLSASFRTETANTLARALRIQTTVVLIDGIMRNDPNHDFSETHLRVFAEVGTLIWQMLSVPLHQRSNEQAAKDLKVKLAKIRGYIIDLSTVVASSSKEMPARDVGTLGVGILGSALDLAGILDGSELGSEVLLSLGDDKGGAGAPKFVHGSHVCALLFLQLVEHLALRSVRLYESWKSCDAVCQKLRCCLPGSGTARSRNAWAAPLSDKMDGVI